MKRLSIVLALLIFSGNAYAQKRFDPIGDIKAANAAKETRETSSIVTFLNDLADIDGALALSQQIPGLQDPVGNACWKQLAPVQELIKAHPLPLTMKIASDIEALRLAAIALNQVCANPNCGQMFLDATNAANAIVSLPIPFSLQSLCSKVPVIGTSAVPTSPPLNVAPTPPK
jgi:hypothetical protein